ncbi:MAG: hypothetical protein JWM68_1371 [Verrucomicrobiales bacterium]|nr:hypothetical protein [Verrucomicrobiales bacterium]
MEPFQITRKELVRLFASPRLVQRMVKAQWITAVQKGRPGTPALFDMDSAKNAYARLLAGETPPLLDCEKLRSKQ